MIEDQSDREELCIHEAAHAIIAVHFKLRIKYVACQLPWDLQEFVKGFVDCNTPKSQAEAVIITTAAAKEAQRHFFKRPDLSGCWGDDDLIKKTAKQAGISAARVQALRRKAAKLVRAVYITASIVRLARELEDHGNLPAARAKYIYRRTRLQKMPIFPGLKRLEDWMFDWEPKDEWKSLRKDFERRKLM